MSVFNFLSPAKINLFLEVTGKRDDGYHELSTLFAKINLADNIRINIDSSDATVIKLFADGPLADALPEPEKNLVYRAAAEFFKKFSITARCEITLTKYIPMGAGLGGGSSNAGCVLKFLAGYYNINKEEVLPLAAKLGADVALFVYDDIFLYGEGIGERLTPVDARGPLPHVVAAYPDAHIATKDVFNKLVLPNATDVLTNKSKVAKIMKSLSEGGSVGEWAPFIFNRLEEVVLGFSAPVRELRNKFQETGAQFVMMSGSGSAVFSLHADADEAERTAGHLRTWGYKVFKNEFSGLG